MTLQAQPPTTVAVGQTQTFNFGGPISAYVVGLSHFDFMFPNHNSNQIQEVSLSLTSDLPNAAAGVLTVTVDAMMRDASNHFLDPASTATVSVLAWLNDASSVSIGNAIQLPDGTTSPPITIPPGAAVNASEALLTGFHFMFEDRDHNVESIQAAATSMFNGTSNTANIQSMARMFDTTNHHATSSIDGGYVCGINTDDFEIVPWAGSGGLAVAPTPPQDPGGWQTATVALRAPARSAALLLTGFSMTYPNNQDHWVSEIAVGCPVVLVSPDGQQVTFYPYAAMMDADIFQHANANVAFGNLQFAVVGVH